MEANKRQYTELVGGSVQYIIPVFQRDYSWMEEQCEQLWDDIERNSQLSGGREHFFGAVVYISTGGQSAAFTRWLLIDGQQRMTTVSLLAAAMRDHIRDKGKKKKAKKIEHDFLVNPFENDDQKHKLVLRAHDQAILRRIVDGDDEPVDLLATVEKNYKFFRDKLRDADVDAILTGVSRLAVVDVRLDLGKDDPQQIFESLNSTGIDLTQADLVRNYVLMGLEQQAQENLYHKYWQKIERLYAGRPIELDNFLGDFVALRTRAQKQVLSSDVYSSFCVAFDDRKEVVSRIEDLLKCMLRFARYHAAFVMGTGEFPAISDRLSRLRTQATTAATLIMRLLDAFEGEHITVEDLVRALELIESYLVRRSVCGQSNRSYWVYFSRLAHALSEDDVLGYLKVNLYWLSGNYAFPTDQEFKRALEQDNLYNRRRICRFLLGELENRRSKERSDTRSLTIEHIMPQNRPLSATWQEELGDNWEDIQTEWLHRLGNLTLTAYNEKYSDRPFKYKKNCTDGFKDSSLRLNKYVAGQNKWTRKRMRKRAKMLAKWALDLWPSLNVSEELQTRVKASGLRDEAGDVEVTGMDDEARALFSAFRSKVPLDDVIEVARLKSVSYHNSEATFFCEVLPRRRYLLLLLSLDVDECAECDLDVRDTAEQNFIVNASNSGGCYLHVYTDDDVDACMPLVLGALAASTD